MTPTKRKSRPQSCELSPAAGVRTGLSVADLKQSFLDNLFCGLGRVRMTELAILSMRLRSRRVK
jgi:hypothetical protein